MRIEVEALETVEVSVKGEALKGIEVCVEVWESKTV